MEYKREEIVSDLCQTSKSSTGKSMLSQSAERHAVYNLDTIKELFCKEYRHSEMIKSCDAFYYDTCNHVIMEFKNTHHMNLKEYYDEIEIKFLDTHMLLGETFYKRKKQKDICNKAKVIVVYNDALNNGKGINQLVSNISEVKPCQGDKSRNSKQIKKFKTDEEFQKAVNDTKTKYEKVFYREIEFIDKKDFETYYIETNYFDALEEWSEMH